MYYHSPILAEAPKQQRLAARNDMTRLHLLGSKDSIVGMHEACIELSTHTEKAPPLSRGLRAHD